MKEFVPETGAKLEQDARTVRTGPKDKAVQQTFALYPDEYRLVDQLKAFRRVRTLLAEHLPALQRGDTLETYFASPDASGPMEVIDFYHLKMSNHKWKSVIAVRLIDERETEKASMEEDDG